MKDRFTRIFALVMAVCLLLTFAGCRKTGDMSSGEWLSEKDYYYYDENGNWVKITDDDFFSNLAAKEEAEQEEAQQNTAVDSSEFETLIDYMGNDGYDKVHDKKNITIESLHSDVLEDDYRMRRYDKQDAYIVYKVDGIAEFLVQYSYGAGDRNAAKLHCYVSKDAINWTEVTAQDSVWQPFNGTSWVRCFSYYSGVDTSNQYLKLYIEAGGSNVFDPNINTVQINGLTDEVLGEYGAYNSSLGAKTIYIDSEKGKDTNAGTSESAPLKTLYAASKKTYAPGSKILLKAGCEFSGSLTLNGNGSASKPITVTSYGKGDKPVINARGGAAILAYGEYITVTGLKITNKTGKAGVSIYATKPGATRGITVTNCDFQDINVNFTNTSYEASGIRLDAVGREPTWFEDVKIENNTFKKVARCGFVLASNWTGKVTNQEWGAKNDIAAGEWFGSKKVVVRNNTFDEIGGDVILLFGCDGAIVERNVVSNAGLFKNMDEIHWAAIWCHSSNNCIFQYNEVYGNSGKNNGYDLQAFDCDIANKDCIFQYNYSHDNDGGFMLLCSNDAQYNAQTTGTIVRYNLSVNDGEEGGMVFDITSSIYDSQIYNNTVYCGKNNVRLVNFANYDGGPNNSKNNVFTNNIFYVKSGVKVTYGIKALESAVFNNNLFYGVDAPPQGNGITVNGVITDDPLFTAVGATGTGLEKIAASYVLKSGSPALTKGIAVANNGGKDIFGNDITDVLMGAIAKAK